MKDILEEIYIYINMLKSAKDLGLKSVEVDLVVDKMRYFANQIEGIIGESHEK